MERSKERNEGAIKGCLGVNARFFNPVLSTSVSHQYEDWK